jgi:hypothetical protein
LIYKINYRILDNASSKYLKKERVVPFICFMGAKKQEKGMKKQGLLHVHLTYLLGPGTSFVEHT